MAIDDDVRDGRQVLRAHGVGDRVAFDGDDIVHMGGWIREGTFPESFRVARLNPDAVVAFIDGSSERDACLLHSADVSSEIHEKACIRGKRAQLLGETGFERETGAGVDPSFEITNRSSAPYDEVTGSHKSHGEGDHGATEAEVE